MIVWLLGVASRGRPHDGGNRRIARARRGTPDWQFPVELGDVEWCVFPDLPIDDCVLGVAAEGLEGTRACRPTCARSDIRQVGAPPPQQSRNRVPTASVPTRITPALHGMTSRQPILRRQRGHRPASGNEQARRPGSGSLRRAALFASVLSVVTGCAVALEAQGTGTVSGRVIDGQTQRPISNVLVRVADTEIESLTDEAGLFALPGISPGNRRLVMEHLSYGEHSRQVLVQAGASLRLEARITQRAIELAPLVVETLTELQRRRVTTGFAMREVVREEIDAAARTGQDLSELLRDRMPSAYIRPGARGSACLETRGGRRGGARCNEVTVMLDGIQVSDPGYLYTTMPLSNIERLELLSVAEAGARYGSVAGGGVLLIETRQGPRPTDPIAAKTVNARFDWSQEESSHPWKRSLLSSFAANAIGFAVTLRLADHCLWLTESGTLGLRTRCNGAATTGIGFLGMGLPAFGSSLAARWGGTTTRSKGRLTPAALAAGLTLMSGYILIINGTDASQAAGAALVTVGVPVLTVLSDRVFRQLR